ncbi:MAG TPA: carbohydrate ABC transporter permease [Clostridiales bacterium]|nr:carbohydrate ABC transporter permease [Clostridiales bacterium]
MAKLYIANKRSKKKKLKRMTKGWAFVYIFMIALVAFTSMPLIYVISTAFKPMDELFVFPPRFFVRRPTIQNFTDLLISLGSATVPFTRYLFNSLFTVTVTVFITVVISSLGAFALVKYKLPGGKLIFSIILAALMFSHHVTQIPNYMVVNSLGIINTYVVLIIPKLAVAYNFFLMKQFIEQFPNELLESGRMDGAKEWGLFWKVVMPSLKPAWSTLVVLSFVSNWNDYFTPLVFTTSEAMKTLPYALNTISSGKAVARVGATSAAVFIITVPTIIIFTAMQSQVMETMVYSGIKA